MKKIVSTLLAGVMVGTMSIPAFAADGPATLEGAGGTHDVTARYEKSETQTVYNVDIQWGNMNFVYQEQGERTWDAEQHTYTGTVSTAWVHDGNEITVTNHSNAPLKVDFSYTQEESFDTITGALSTQSDVLESGERKSPDKADAVTTALTLSGELASNITTATKVGTVTVTIGNVSDVVIDRITIVQEGMTGLGTKDNPFILNRNKVSTVTITGHNFEKFKESGGFITLEKGFSPASHYFKDSTIFPEYNWEVTGNTATRTGKFLHRTDNKPTQISYSFDNVNMISTTSYSLDNVTFIDTGIWVQYYTPKA